jgi:MFS superfamily sulfate permease-like transporter
MKLFFPLPQAPRLEVSQLEMVQMLTLTAGLIQIGMAILRIEFLASYLSDQLVSMGNYRFL